MNPGLVVVLIAAVMLVYPAAAAPKKVNGVCGSANGTTTDTAPTTNLCSAGTPSSVTGTGPWFWTCAGIRGGSTAQCEAFVASTDPSAFYIAPNGSDSSPGTLNEPFATIARAQQAMQGSTTKTTYIRAGTYNLPGVASDCDGTSGFQLVAADTGETWSYYPPDGPGTAILDGGSTDPTTGVRTGICINGTSGATINGLQVQRFIHTLIQNYDPNVTITNNILHDYTEHSNNGAINYGGPNFINMTISNNYIYNAPERGVSGGPCLYAGCAGAGQNLTISNNYIYNTCTVVADCGAIYYQDFQSPRSTGIKINYNYISDVSGNGTDGRGIYLDDGASNATVNGNIVIGATTTCFNIHGGTNDQFTGNICDEDSQVNNRILFYQNSDVGGNNGDGNVVTNNIIISGQSGGGGGYDGDTVGTPPTIGNNFYHNYVGTSINSSGAFNDPNPTTGDPQISCWVYSIASGSPVFNAPVSFPGIVGGWGPPGFVVPQIGTPPSNPHGC